MKLILTEKIKNVKKSLFIKFLCKFVSEIINFLVMKKYFLFFAFLLVSTCLFAQLNESFEGNVFPPSAWTKQSPDGGTGWRVDTVGTAINGWTSGTIDVPAGGGNQVAFISYIDGGATSNDAWLITPQITPTTGEFLTFYMKNFFTSYADTIDILVSTTNNNLSSFTVNLHSIGYWNGMWTKYNIDLSAYVNQPIYIAFREHVSDNQNDGAAIGLDLVKKEIPVSNDMAVTGVNIPTGIVYPGNITVKAQLINIGTQTQTSGKIVSFYNGNTLLGNVLTSNAIPMGGTDSVSFTWNNVAAGSYLIKAFCETDQDTTNNMASTILTVYPFGAMIESFENIASIPPLGWSNPTGGWLLGTNPVNAFEGVQYAYLPANTNNQLLITPKLQVNSGDSITFMAYSLATTLNPTLKIQYSSDKINWTDLPGANYTMTTVYNKFVGTINFSGSYYFAFLGDNNSSASLRLDFVVAPQIIPTMDLTVLQMTEPATGCLLTNNEQVSAYIYNPGLINAFNFQISYQKNNISPVTETVTDTVVSGGYLLYKFSQKVDLSAIGTDSIRIWVKILNDDNTSNDTLNYTQVSNLQAINAPVSMGFENGEDLTGWILRDMNGDGVSWSLGNTSGLSNTGTNYAVYNYSSVNSADDWLISRCYNLTTSQLPYLSFYYRAMQGYPEKLNVYLMTSSLVKDTLLKIVDLSNITNTAYMQSITPFSVPANGVYFIGFHSYSNADMWRLLLDDIVLGIDAGLNDNNKKIEISIHPNPANDIAYITSNYKIAEIEIYNSLSQKIFKAKPDTHLFSFNTNSFSKGIYFIKIKSQKGETIQKLIIK